MHSYNCNASHCQQERKCSMCFTLPTAEHHALPTNGSLQANEEKCKN